MYYYRLILMAIMMWREGGDVTQAERVGMGWTAKNRTTTHGFPGNTVIETISQPYQYDGMTVPGDPGLVRWPAEDDLMNQCMQAASEILSGGNDPTGGAVFYYNPPITAPPTEWGDVVETLVIGITHFYKKA